MTCKNLAAIIIPLERGTGGDNINSGLIKPKTKAMSKKNYNHCEGCGLEFHNDLLVMNDDLELTCEECVEEGKVDKRVSNLLTAACVFIAFTAFVLIFHHCSK